MTENIQILKEKLEKIFIINFNETIFFERLENFKNSSHSFHQIYSSFYENIKSIISTATLPETMTTKRAKLVMFDKLMTQELILSAPKPSLDDSPNDETVEEKENRLKIASQKAHEKFFELFNKTEGKQQFWFISLQFLNDITNNSFEIAAKELLNQTLLSTWTTFEVFFRDCFVKLLNQNNELIEKICEDSTLKQKFSLKNIPIEKLLEYNYNLSNNMGDVLIENFEFSNLDIIKTIYKHLFNSQNLNNKLNNNDFWLLYKRRNLIIHKGGIVDNQYLLSTSDNIPLGTKLYLTPTEIIKCIELVCEASIELKKEIEKICA